MAKWAQHEVKLRPFQRGCHLITDQIQKQISSSLSAYSVGLANIFLQHTSASLTINENADPDVRVDMETFLSEVVPEGRSAPWIHTDEGDDDMPGHIKSSMFGASLMVPITKGRLNLGTWQGIYLCEHRDHANGRRLVVTLQGDGFGCVPIPNPKGAAGKANTQEDASHALCVGLSRVDKQEPYDAVLQLVERFAESPIVKL